MVEGLLRKAITMESQYTTTATLLQYFTDSTPVVEGKFDNNQVVIAKENQGDQGSKEYSKSYSLITEYLETKNIFPMFAMAKSMAIPNIETFNTNLLVIIKNLKYKNIIEKCMLDVSDSDTRISQYK